MAEARQTGLLALKTQTTSSDPMQADLVGISLATAPGNAAYLPLAHGAGAGDLLGGGPPRARSVRAALGMLKPLLEDRSVLKIAHNVKYDLGS